MLLFFINIKNLGSHAKTIENNTYTTTLEELSNLFVYFSIGFICLAAILSGVLAKTLPGKIVIFSGFAYVILFVIGPMFRAVRDKKAPEKNHVTESVSL